MKGIRWLFLASIVAAGSGCATAVMTGAGQDGYDPDDRGVRQVRTDAEISAAVTRAFVHSRQIPAMAIKVRTYRGRVTLSGRISDRATARQAARLYCLDDVARVLDEIARGLEPSVPPRPARRS